MVTTIYIVRHCQSQGNLGGRFQGQTDAEITTEGKRQLELLSLRFRNITIDRIYTSPLKRAIATAEAVNRFHNLPIKVSDELIEIDVGDMANLSFQEVVERFPELAKNWNESPDLCCFPNGETMKAVYRRSSEFVNRIASENLGKTCVLATHGGVIRNMYAYIACGEIEGLRKSVVFGNTSVSIIEVDSHGRYTWKIINDLSHLPERKRDLPMEYKFKLEEK